MDYEKEIERLKGRIACLEQTIRETSVPIISSIVNHTILVPIVGYSGGERFELIRTKVHEYISKHPDVNCAIFDFSGADLDEKDHAEFDQMAIELGLLNNTLKLMDIRPILVGFNPQIVRKIVLAGIHMDFETYGTFRAALKVLLKEEGRSLKK
ncbi:MULTISPECIES: STAS domain-containing protein [Sporosarcina]|uniref:STAS domain-containing protein n=1 Tax=Sporosarcina contaminans TaxID=633403 RepID=A0ABW3TXG1_9BACL